jgi:predicted HicB family RNase H-like nuclease
MEAALERETEDRVEVILDLPKKLHQEALVQAMRMGISLKKWIFLAIKSQLSLR